MAMRARKEMECFGLVESGQLWRNLADGSTAFVTVCTAGVVHARCVAGPWRGPLEDFEAQFERIPDYDTVERRKKWRRDNKHLVESGDEV